MYICTVAGKGHAQIIFFSFSRLFIFMTFFSLFFLGCFPDFLLPFSRLFTSVFPTFYFRFPDLKSDLKSGKRK